MFPDDTVLIDRGRRHPFPLIFAITTATPHLVRQ
jgi:hypothetical protein